MVRKATKPAPPAPDCTLWCTCPLHDEPVVDTPPEVHAPKKRVQQHTMAEGMWLFMGIDPGGSCGLAVIGYDAATQEPKLIGSGTYDHRDMMVMLRHNISGIDGVGVEEYRLYSTSMGAQAGATQLTSQSIGSIEELCTVRGVVCELQPASIKAPALEWARNKWPDLDLSYYTQHEKDAKAHAIWQLRQFIYKRPGKGLNQ